MLSNKSTLTKKEIKIMGNIDEDPLKCIFKIKKLLLYLQSYVNINALLDTCQASRTQKKNFVYIELSGLQSLEYRDNYIYRSSINSFVTNIRNQLSLDFFTLKYYLSPLTQTHLEYLGLVNQLNFTNRLEITNVEHLINVKILDLSGCGGIKDFSSLGFGSINELIIKDLDEICGIQYLNSIPTINFGTSKVLQNDVNYLRNVKNFSIWGNTNITSVEFLSKAAIVDLSFCKNITDVSYLRNLKKLTLKHCLGIVDVSQLGNIPELDLSYCINLEDVSGLQNVRVLYLRGCSKVKDVSKLGNVDTLYLSCCCLITDVDQLGFVRKLVLYGCDGVNDVSHLKNVKVLNLQNCQNISDISMLINIVPKLLYDRRLAINEDSFSDTSSDIDNNY